MFTSVRVTTSRGVPCHGSTVGREVRILRPFVLQNLTRARHDFGFICIEILFVLSGRYSHAVERTAAMSGRTYGVAGGCGGRVAGLLSTPRRSGAGLQQEPG